MSSTGIIYHGPRNPNPRPGEARIIIYGYVPSLVLAIIGVVTFALILITHIFYAIRRRGFRAFHILIAVGSLMEMGGYAARIASHRRPFVIGSFIAQYFLIVVAPVLFSAAIYLSLSLAIRRVKQSESLLILRPKTMLAIFITADVITTIIQIAGAALIGTSESDTVSGKVPPITPQQANDILIAGLATQCASFLIFLTILFVALTRALRFTFEDEGSRSRLLRFLITILVASSLILLRTVYRLAESIQGFFGFASVHEALFAVFEYLPVILALIILSAFPPSTFLRDHIRSEPVKDGEKSEARRSEAP